MNLKLVLKTYSNLRQLTDDESALLETLRAMNDSERELLVESLGPQKPAAKKSGKKAGKKSARASGIETQLGNRRQGQQKINKGACTYVLKNGAVCNTGDNNPIHDETFGYAGYHPFTPAASPAPSPSDQVSSEIGAAGVGVVAQGASGGD